MGFNSAFKVLKSRW